VKLLSQVPHGCVNHAGLCGIQGQEKPYGSPMASIRSVSVRGTPRPVHHFNTLAHGPFRQSEHDILFTAEAEIDCPLRRLLFRATLSMVRP